MDKSVKVMHVVLGLETGGLEQVAINLTELLDKTRFHPVICCLEGKGDLSDEAEKAGIKVIAMNKRYGVDYRLIPRLISLFRKEHVQIVHTHNPLPHLYGGLAAKFTGVPIIIHTKHGRNCPDIRKNVVRNRFLSFFTDKIVAVSEDAQNVALYAEGVPSRRVTTIINGIKIKKYQTKANGDHIRSKLGIFPGAYVIGNVARLSPEKDHLTLLKAFARVLQDLNDVILVVVGDGILRSELENSAKKLGVFERTLFLGFRRDIPELLQSFDLFVLSSTTEGTSLTILEAMAAGLPVIATDVGGNSGLVRNDVTGMLVPPNRPEILADSITKLLGNKTQRMKLGITGYNRVCELFSLEGMVKSYQEIYDHFLTLKGISSDWS